MNRVNLKEYGKRFFFRLLLTRRGILTMSYMEKIRNRLTRHLRENDQGYFTHMSDAWSFAARSGLASLGFFVHGILPFTFEHSGSGRINKLNKDIEIKMSKHHNSPTVPQ